MPATIREMKAEITKSGFSRIDLLPNVNHQMIDTRCRCWLPGDLVYTHTLDMRFVGQAFEVGVEIPPDKATNLDAKYIAELFADAHHRTFMHGATLDRPVEIVTLRVGATLPIGAAPKLDRETLERAPESTRIFHGDGWIDCTRHTAEALKAGQKIEGPSVIEGYTATTWVPPGWTATLDQSDNLILQKAAGRTA